MLYNIGSNSRAQQDIQEMDTQPSPSLISIKQRDIRIVIDDLYEAEEEDCIIVNPVSRPRDPIYYINKMIREIKTVSKRKKPSSSLCECYTCHYCNALLDNKYLLHCTETDCSQSFCLRCINKQYSLQAEDIYQIMKLEDWSCYSCKAICSCKTCKERFFGKVNLLPALILALENDQNLPEISSKVVSQLKALSNYSKSPTNFETSVNNSSLNEKKAMLFNSLEREVEPEALEKVNETPGITARTFKIRRNRSMRLKEECHMCNRPLPNSHLATCSSKLCRAQFCIPCVQTNYYKDFRLDMYDKYDPKNWVCFRCKGNCKCVDCEKLKNKLLKSTSVRRRDDRRLKKKEKKTLRRGLKYKTNTKNKSSEFTSNHPTTKRLVTEQLVYNLKEQKKNNQVQTKLQFSNPEKVARKDTRFDKKDIHDSKIISEVNIDSACITLYDAENLDQLKSKGDQRISR